MSASLDRRGFLRGLSSLPLVGGGVTIIGQPTAVAEPVTRSLLDNYETWLATELRHLVFEVRPHGPRGILRSLEVPAWHWHEERAETLLPSTRAALVLAAVGCDWREGDR